MKKFTWLRVNKQQRCAICDHADWCTFCPDLNLACCMRVDGGKPAKNGGSLHSLGDTTRLRPLPVKAPPPVTINATAMMSLFSHCTSPEEIEGLAWNLGVTGAALAMLGVAWARPHNAWAFPMRDWQGHVVGIRLRSNSGRKFAVTGSKAGLFYAEGESLNRTTYICEGPTDTAAGLSIGLDAIGRPACLGSEMDTNRLLRRKQSRRAVLICDDDGPGYRGAVRLAAALSVPSVFWVPPAKDLRQFVSDGGTREVIDATIRSLRWQQPQPHHEPALT